MSSKNIKRREKFSPPDIGTLPAEAMAVDEWVPDYGRQCVACGQSPVVTGVREGKIVYTGSLCGACTWGDDACSDPSRW
ncbi:hypothetical protein PPMP20_26575 [Paraburkholderia phymatum]|uniref:hypothetical protein n=1 Tax=Paraburkholderia phymatum TaxID=148447 RepID=UPI00031CD9FB|nr:hypothetical protein [Paraburkholderia phymatum]